MKDLYLKFRDWLNYVRNYKENKENDLIFDLNLIEKQREIDKQKVEIAGYKCLIKEIQNLIHLQEERIHKLKNKFKEKMLLIKDLDNQITTYNDRIQKLENKLANKEHSRKISAGAVGGLKAKINQLQKELDKANYTIEFYKTHQKSPTVEEIKAYDYQFKQVEKKLKK